MVAKSEVKAQKITTTKHPLETLDNKASTEATKTHRHGKASADGAKALTIAKHLHARGPKQHRRQSLRLSNKTIDATKRPRMGPTRSQQQSICMRGGLTAAKHPLQPTKHHPSNENHRRGKASAEWSNTLTAAKHLHARRPRQHWWRSVRLSNKAINTGKHPRMGPTRSQQHNICMRGGLSDDYGYTTTN